ncbi:hypothetical protein EV182_004303 [Spiromyces aspiralis]|uniref:Uncharacterized protein n=1 Tax=Spiromyces aspiralis TaxID=68401 RepID=A0ACC1HVD3_9FUNG|nr:hypothetical protein EV182_004303 [Spiromyces aspiralis]
MAGRKRLDWYLSRELADRVDEDSIRLNFESKGPGRQGDDFYLQDMRDQCVNCGMESNLTLHHVGKYIQAWCVPYRYRKWFPKHNHDLLAMCLECHDKYETKATELTRDLARCFDAPVDGKGWVVYPEVGVGKKAAMALLKYRDRIPEPRVRVLEQAVCNSWASYCSRHGQCPDTQRPSSAGDAVGHGKAGLGPGASQALLVVASSLMKLEERERGPDFSEHGELVVNCVMAEGRQRQGGDESEERMCQDCKKMCEQGLDGLAERWRRHFSRSQELRHLPRNW